MAIPARWKPQPLLSGERDLKALFRREGTSAELRVYCQGATVDATKLWIRPLRLIDQDTVANEHIWPQYALGDGKYASQFWAFAGVAKDGSRKNYYIAWKMSRGSGCKYGIYMSVKQEEAKQVEGEFIAIARSLK